MSEKNILVCSEYNMPSDFKCIWKKSVKTSLKIEKQEERTEKLFMLNPKKYGLKPIESETITDIL